MLQNLLQRDWQLSVKSAYKCERIAVAETAARSASKSDGSFIATTTPHHQTTPTIGRISSKEIR
jgi:hypothetical protein